MTGESVSTVVHKPYEPPAIGKSSRVTPVGLDEEPERLSADSRVDNDSVDIVLRRSMSNTVLSVNTNSVLDATPDSMPTMMRRGGGWWAKKI